MPEKFLPGGPNIPGSPRPPGMRTFFGPPQTGPAKDKAFPKFVSANGNDTSFLRNVIGIVGAALCWGAVEITPAQPAPVASQYEYGNVSRFQASQSYGDVWGPQLGAPTVTALPVFVDPTPQVGTQITPIVQTVLIQQFQDPPPSEAIVPTTQDTSANTSTVWGQVVAVSPVTAPPIVFITSAPQPPKVDLPSIQPLDASVMPSATAPQPPEIFWASPQVPELVQPDLWTSAILAFASAQSPIIGEITTASPQFFADIQPNIGGQDIALIPPVVQSPTFGLSMFASPQTLPDTQPSITGQDATLIPPAVSSAFGELLSAAPQVGPTIQPTIGGQDVALITEVRPTDFGKVLSAYPQVIPTIQPVIGGQETPFIPSVVPQAPTFGMIIMAHSLTLERFEGPPIMMGTMPPSTAPPAGDDGTSEWYHRYYVVQNHR